jgi:hypothetical protein
LKSYGPTNNTYNCGIHNDESEKHKDEANDGIGSSGFGFTQAFFASGNGTYNVQHGAVDNKNNNEWKENNFSRIKYFLQDTKNIAPVALKSRTWYQIFWLANLREDGP